MKDTPPPVAAPLAASPCAKSTNSVGGKLFATLTTGISRRSSSPTSAASPASSITVATEMRVKSVVDEDDDEGDDDDFQDAVDYGNQHVTDDMNEDIGQRLDSLETPNTFTALDQKVSSRGRDNGSFQDDMESPILGKKKSFRQKSDSGGSSPVSVTPKLTKQEIVNMRNEATDEALLDDIVKVEKALELFLNSKFKDAEELLLPKYGQSMYFTEGVALLRTLRAVMTFDPDDMTTAIESLAYAAEIASIFRKQEKTSVMSMLSGAANLVTGTKDPNYLNGMTRVQKHAELVHSECSVMQSCLTLIAHTNIVNFVKEGMQMRSCFATIKACFRFLEKIYEEEGVEGYNAHYIDEHFTSGIVMNAGLLALILSFLPPKVIKVFEMIGFIGDRDIALDRLSTAADWPFTPSIFVSSNTKHKFKRCFPTPHNHTGVSGGLRKSFSELILLAYHIVLASLNPLPDCNLPLASAKLDACLAQRQESFIYRALRARMLETQAHPEEAEAEYSAVIALQRDYQQLYHACLWDMGLCRMAQLKWEAASKGYLTLYEESKWSRAVYRYTQATTMYSIKPGDTKVAEMMAEIPGLVRKIAGITVPLEKFVSRKSRKFLKQGNRLLFPAYEMLYFFHGLVMMSRDTLKVVVEQATAALKELDDKKAKHVAEIETNVVPYETFYDDVCLTLFIRAIALRELGYPTSLSYVEIKNQVLVGRSYKAKIAGESLPNPVDSLSVASDDDIRSLMRSIADFKSLVSHSRKIVLDHWMLIFGRYELGSLYLRIGEFDLARREFDAAQNKGITDGESSENPGVKKASLENMLQVRCHNALLKLRALEETSKIM